MQRWPLILALFGLLLSHLSNTLLWLDFEAQREYYAEELCLMKEIEGNDCQGSCQIRAILEADSQESPALPAYQEDILLAMDFERSWTLEHFSGLKPELFHFNSLGLGTKSISGIWRPPRV